MGELRACEPRFVAWTRTHAIPHARTQKQIRDAYRKAALNMHPDKAVSLGLSKEEAEDQFKKLQASAVDADGLR